MKTFYVREKATGKQLVQPNEVWEELKHIGIADQETFWIIGFNGGMKEIYRECVFIGGEQSSIVDPKIVFKRLLLRDCSSFIVAHNHPSDNLAPSEQDYNITALLDKGAQLLSLKLLDHVIIGEGGFFSFKNEGLL